MSGTPPEQPAPSVPKMKVLVVDDEPKIVRLIKQKLEANHYDVVTAASGEQALRQAHAHRLDLILLDLMMPAMDGLEVLTRLRSTKDTRRIPVVIVSARQDTQAILKSQDLWAADYVTKPLDLETLVQTVKRCAKLSLE